MVAEKPSVVTPLQLLAVVGLMLVYVCLTAVLFSFFDLSFGEFFVSVCFVLLL